MEVEKMIKIIKEVTEIAKKAGDKIMEIYQNEDDFNVESKSDNSPLTKADRAANEIICSGLEALEIKYPIISEENKNLEYADRKDWEFCWMVDPLDGTKEFIKRNGEFTVNIALIRDGRSIAGVVFAPALNELYWAIKGQGAFIHKNGESAKLTAASFSKSDNGLRFVCSRSHLNQDTSDYMAKFDAPVTVSKGSSLKFLILANSEADIYPRMAPTMEWDTAAAQIVLEEAGGSVINNETGGPLMYNKENLLNPYFIAFANES